MSLFSRLNATVQSVNMSKVQRYSSRFDALSNRICKRRRWCHQKWLPHRLTARHSL